MLITLLREGLGRLIVLANFLTRPAKIRRSAAEQAKINAEAQALSLYQFYACPFCVRTRRAIHRLNVPISLRDAQNNPQHRQDLLTQGGAIKVPCLRIDEAGKTTWMYESKEIIQYLEKRFAG